MGDILERIITESGDFFGICCNTTALVNEACRKHDVGPLAATALGRSLTGAVLLASLLKDNQSVQLKFEGNGPLGKIITEAGARGWARGYIANPHANLPLKNNTIDVAAGIGRAGFLTVTKNIGDNKKYPGIIQLYTSEIGEDLAYYLTVSEQTPSTIALSIRLNREGIIEGAAGLLVQSLPPANEQNLLLIEKRLEKLSSLAELLNKGKSPGDILATLFADIPHKKTAATPLSFSCSCSLEKMERALLSLGREELTQLLEKEGGTEVRCEFCRDSYQFDGKKLEKLLALS
ncbi:Hsp33 family molecular chaperone HslO [Desulfomarina sp.]